MNGAGQVAVQDGFFAEEDDFVEDGTVAENAPVFASTAACMVFVWPFIL